MAQIEYCYYLLLLYFICTFYLTISYLLQSGLKTAIVGHLSKENNFPELAYKTVVNELIDDNRDCSKIKVNVANRSNPSPIINIS